MSLINGWTHFKFLFCNSNSTKMLIIYLGCRSLSSISALLLGTWFVNKMLPSMMDMFSRSGRLLWSSRMDWKFGFVPRSLRSIKLTSISISPWSMANTWDINGRMVGSICTHKSATLITRRTSFSELMMSNVSSTKLVNIFDSYKNNACSKLNNIVLEGQ